MKFLLHDSDRSTWRTASSRRESWRSSRTCTSRKDVVVWTSTCSCRSVAFSSRSRHSRAASRRPRLPSMATMNSFRRLKPSTSASPTHRSHSKATNDWEIKTMDFTIPIPVDAIFMTTGVNTSTIIEGSMCIFLALTVHQLCLMSTWSDRTAPTVNDYAGDYFFMRCVHLSFLRRLCLVFIGEWILWQSILLKLFSCWITFALVTTLTLLYYITLIELIERFKS